MNKEIVISELRTLLEAITEQFVILERADQEPLRFEFDLLTENVRKLHDKLQILNGILFPGSAPSEGKKETGSRVEPRKATLRKKQEVSGPDLFSEEENVFKIRLKEAREQSLGTNTAARPETLKTRIGINDKFLFINDLFSGSLTEYNKAIDALSGAGQRKEVYELLDSLCRKNLWDTGSEAFRKLKEMVDRQWV